MVKTVKTLKQDLIDTVAKIDKEKLTIVDLKTLSETVGIIANIKEENVDFSDIFAKISSCNAYKPQTVHELKECE